MKRIAKARTVSTSILLIPSKVYVRRSPRSDLPRARTVNEGGRRGFHNPPPQ
jgi:hypothetical protein